MLIQRQPADSLLFSDVLLQIQLDPRNLKACLMGMMCNNWFGTGKAKKMQKHYASEINPK